MTTWFTSDLHLNHRAAIRMCERPFENVEEMNETIIRNINAVVRPNDTLYLQGDLCHRTGIDTGSELISRIKCKNKVLVKGNHDKKWHPELFIEICDFKEIHEQVNGENYHISLMHFPMLSWPKSHHGSIHLHGHIHSRGEYNLQQRSLGIKRYDIGVDANNFYPVSLEQIIAFFNEGENNQSTFDETQRKRFNKALEDAIRGLELEARCYSWQDAEEYQEVMTFLKGKKNGAYDE